MNLLYFHSWDFVIVLCSKREHSSAELGGISESDFEDEFHRIKVTGDGPAAVSLSKIFNLRF